MQYTSGHTILALSGERGAEEVLAGGHVAVAVNWRAHMCKAFSRGLSAVVFHPMGVWEGLTGACRECPALQHEVRAAVCGRSASMSQGAQVGTLRGESCLRCTVLRQRAKLSPFEAVRARRQSGRLPWSVLTQPGNAWAGCAGGRRPWR